MARHSPVCRCVDVRRDATCGCSSARRARPRHASWRLWPRVRTSSSAPLRVCPCTPRSRQHDGETRPGNVRRHVVCARLRAANHRVRRDDSRAGTAEVDWLSLTHSSFIALVAQPEDQPPCQRQVARSLRAARQQQDRSPRRAHASRAESGRNDWAAPEPVTGWMSSGVQLNGGSNCHASRRMRVRLPPLPPRFLLRFVNSAVRVPACLAGSRGFNPRTRRHIHTFAEVAQR